MILIGRPCRRRSLLTLSSIGLITLTSLLITLLAACGVSSSGGGLSQTMPTVSVLDNIFTPKELHIKVGQTVLWVNKAPPNILRVPEDFATIQAAVNAIKPGDMISIAPNIYHEAVEVRTPHLPAFLLVSL